MNSKQLSVDPAIHFLTRIFQHKGPDTVQQISLRPVVAGDLVLCSVAAHEDCVALENQINIITRSTYRNPLMSSADIYIIKNRSDLIVSALNGLFWECAEHCFPIIGEYNEIGLKGNYEIVAPRTSVHLGPDGLGGDHPIHTFYLNVSRILSGDTIFSGTLKPVGTRGIIVGKALNPITQQMQFLWQEMAAGLRDLHTNHPSLNATFRYDATIRHMEMQISLVDCLTAMTLELEDIDYEEAESFQSKSGHQVVFVIDEKWNIICISLEDFQKG